MAETPTPAPVAPKASGRAPKDVMVMLEYYLKDKAPYQIPEAGRLWIVKYGPWIQLVLLFLALLIIIPALGLTLVFLPLATATGSGIGLVFFVTLVQVALEVAALPGLFARKKQGWTLAFYAMLVGVVANLLTLNILGAILGLVIGGYLLFQIKSHYA